MHKIYFEERCVVICGPGDSILEDPNSVVCTLGKPSDVPALAMMFKDSPTIPRIVIPSEDEAGTYRLFCSAFKEVDAGGGLVSNRRGDYLLISRNGLWDLPKGHREPGEPIEVTALREVREETGVDELELGELICITDHCYLRNDIWHLKHTWWFAMNYTNPTDLTPQREEDISKAAWVAKSSLPAFLTNTYPSVKQIFEKRV